MAERTPTLKGDMRIFREAGRTRAETITLPDGHPIMLDRDWSEYTIEDLAASGVTPEMGADTGIEIVVKVVPREPT